MDHGLFGVHTPVAKIDHPHLMGWLVSSPRCGSFWSSVALCILSGCNADAVNKASFWSADPAATTAGPLQPSGNTAPPPLVADGAALQQQIDRAIASGESSVIAASEEYAFPPGVSLRIASARQLSIQGGPNRGSENTAPGSSAGPTTPTTTLWFVCGAGVHVANSTDVTFARFIIDYKEPCFSQGKVVTAPTATTKQDENVMVLFDDVNFPSATKSQELAAPNGSLKVTYWDPTTLRIVAHGNHLVQNVSTDRGTGITTIGYSGQVRPAGTVTAGTLVTMHPRLGISHGTGVAGGLTYMVTNSTRVSTINVTLHGGATESVVEGGGQGNHTYRLVRVVRRDDQTPVRLLAANADGFHSSCVTIGPKLLDSEISWTGDDLLNIHSRISIVMEPLSPTSAYVIDVVGSSSPADYDDSTLTFERTHLGDSIAFWTLGTLAPNGSSTITALRRMHDPALAAAALAAYTDINSPPYSQRISHPIGSRVWLVNWTEPVVVARLGLVDVPRLRPHGAQVLRCYMHDSYMRIGLYDSPGQTIQGNHFARAFPLYVGESGDGWLEGPPVVGPSLVRDNIFEDVFGDCPWNAHPTTTHDVVFRNNSCVDADGNRLACPSTC